MATSTVVDDTFDTEVLDASTPVIVDFWAEWCGPCKQIAPALEEISEEMGGKVKIVKMDIDQNPNMPMKYGVRAIPTLILFKDGEAVSVKSGALPKGQLVSWINGEIGQEQASS